jgi:hypothetical protein
MCELTEEEILYLKSKGRTEEEINTLMKLA